MIKFLATISTFVYFAVTSGIIVNVHYCMNEFDSAQLYKTSTEVCSRCGMHTSDSNGCCHDELKIVKLSDNHVSSQLNLEIKAPEAIVVQHNDLISSANIEKVQSRDFQNHSPPLLHNQYIYIQNCVFRI